MRILYFYHLIFVFALFITFAALENNGTYLLKRRRRGIFKTVCYRRLACFYTGPPFFQIPFRMLSLPPVSPDIIRTSCLLYTRMNRYNPVVFPPDKPELILNSEFNSTAWTRILIHGYLDGTYSTDWLFNAKDELLRSADDNVIILDAMTTLLPPRIIYQQSVADTRLIGVQLANLITFLKEKLGVDLKKVHLIGHSLGAHTAGYAVERVPGIGRITGLDPAGPYYRNVPRNVQLDDTDATFVDVIHANPAPNLLLGLGTVEDGGHINFWPNGGKQRGCGLTTLRSLFNQPFPTSIQTVFNCRHQRAFEFFISSFNQMDCLFVGVECINYRDFLQGRCNCGADGNKCSFMGMFATPKSPPKRRYYLQVAHERPFCLHQYQLIVLLKATGNVSKTIKSKANFTIFGEKHFLQKELSLKVDLSIPEQVNTFLLTSFQRIGKIQSVEVSPLYRQNHERRTVIKAVEVNYLHPEATIDSENQFCRISSEQNKKLKGNIEFLPIYCNHRQKYS